jgi:hypothetical protein
MKMHYEAACSINLPVLTLHGDKSTYTKGLLRQLVQGLKLSKTLFNFCICEWIPEVTCYQTAVKGSRSAREYLDL